MTPNREERRAIWLRPLAVWAALMLAGLASLLYAIAPGLPDKPLVGLAVTALQASLVLGLLMQLHRAGALIRMTALIAVVWLGFLFLMSWADILTR